MEITSKSYLSLLNGGGGYQDVDGFHTLYTASLTKANIRICQDKTFRESIGRNTENLELNDFNENDVFVYNITGDKCYEAIFNAYNRDKINKKQNDYKIIQKSIFDFL